MRVLRFAVLACLACAACAKKPAPVVMVDASGKVMYREAPGARLRPVDPGSTLAEGCQVVTPAPGKVGIVFPDGSRVDLGPNSTFWLDRHDSAETGLRLGVGVLTAQVRNLAGRRFRVQSPACVASVRGTHFRFAAAEDGRTVVDLFSGAVSVQDNMGGQMDLSAGQRLAVGREGGLSGAEAMSIPETVRAAPLALEPEVRDEAPVQGRVASKREKLKIPNKRLRVAPVRLQAPKPLSPGEAQTPDSELEAPDP